MLNCVRLWIYLSAVLVAGGWILSAAHALNRLGYGILFALAGALLLLYRLRHPPAPASESPAQKAARLCRKLQRRFRRPMPLLFGLLAILTLVGPLLYIPEDGDGSGYRTPRVMHWLWAQHWHWIQTTDFRMNIPGCNFEWLTAPLILFTRTDRSLFLIDWLSYLLLPGLIFSVFRRLGVAHRVAWWWMWLLSSGWCFVMQAGSISDDFMAAIYGLAAVDLTLRARERQSGVDLALGLLATALVTGVKQTNTPLALIGLIAAWPCRQLFFRRPLASLGLTAWMVLVSIIPITVFNLKHVGTWTGIQPGLAGELHSPFWGILGNTFCLPVQNFMPPFFPWADRWDHAMVAFLATPFGAHFSSFERFGYLRHSVANGSTGLGPGICVPVLATLVIALGSGRRSFIPVFSSPLYRGAVFWLLRLVPWALLLVFMAKVGTFANARHLTPYYLLFFPLLLAIPVQAQLLRHTWWRLCGILVMLGTAGLIIVSRSQPLFPVDTLVAHLEAKHPHSRLAAQLKLSYGFRSTFEELRDPFTKSIPPGETLIAYLTARGFAEPGLALPLGRLQVERMLFDESPDELRLHHIHYVVVDEIALDWLSTTIEPWLAQYHGHVADQLIYATDPYVPPHHLYLVHLD